MVLFWCLCSLFLMPLLLAAQAPHAQALPAPQLSVVKSSTGQPVTVPHPTIGSSTQAVPKKPTIQIQSASTGQASSAPTSATTSAQAVPARALPAPQPTAQAPTVQIPAAKPAPAQSPTVQSPAAPVIVQQPTTQPVQTGPSIGKPVEQPTQQPVVPPAIKPTEQQAPQPPAEKPVVGKPGAGGALQGGTQSDTLFKQLFANKSIVEGGALRIKAQQLQQQPHIATWYTGENRRQLFASVSSLYTQALDLFARGYNELGITIDAAQRFNYVVIAIYDLINLYLDEMRRQANELNVVQAKGEDIDPAVALLQRFVDDADRTINGLQKYIAQHDEIVATAYKQQRDQLLFSTYSLLLINLAATTKQPIAGPQGLPDSYYQAQIAQANSLFIKAKTLWAPTLRVPGYKNADEIRVIVYRSMASLYALRAFNALKTMRTADPLPQLKQRVTLSMSQFDEAIALYKEVAQDPESVRLMTAYQHFRDQLATGMQLLETADKEADPARKGTVLRQAHDALLAGGAEILAGLILYTALRTDADNLLQQANQALQSLPVPDPQSFTDELSTALATLTTMIKTLNDTSTSYQKAVQDYEQAVAAVDLPASNLQQKITLLSVAQELITMIVIALSQLHDGLMLVSQAATAETVGLVNDAKLLFAKAVATATDVDRKFNQTKGLGGYLAWYQRLPDQQVPLARLIQSYIVYGFQGLATIVEQRTASAAQTALLYQYYLTAYTYRNVLPLTVAQTLQSKLATYDLLAKAQAAYQAAREATNWTVTPSSPISPADSAWQQAISTAFAAYATYKVSGQFEGAMQLYVAIAKDAARLYLQQSILTVPWTVPLQAAIRLYRAYGVYTLEGMTSDVDTIAKTMTPWLSDFFIQGQKLQQQSQSGTLAARVDAYKQLLIWQAAFDAAYQEQDHLKQELVPLGLTTLTSLLTTSSTGNQRLFSSPIAATSMVMPVLIEKTLAELYVQQAQAATTHKDARNNYQAALELYTKLGDTTQLNALQTLYAQEKVLADAENYDQMVIAFGPDSALFEGATVFARYFLSVYLERIPTLLPLPQPLTDLLSKLARATSAQEQKIVQESPQAQALLATTLPVLAQAVYLANALTTNNLLDAVAGIDLYALVLKGEPINNPAVQPYLDDAHAFGSKLNEALQGTRLGNTSLSTKLALYASSGHFSLVYGNRPITAIPEITSAHPWDPTALAYYTQSAEKYKAAGKEDEAMRLQKKMSNTFLSHAYGLVKRAAFMQGRETDEALIRIVSADPQEFQQLITTKTQLTTSSSTVLTPAILAAIKLVQLYYGAALGDIADAALGSETYTAFSGMVYEESADFLRAWLKGDPFSDAYQSFISPINQSYLLAQGAYQQAQKPQKVKKVGLKIASLFEQVGDACNEAGKFLPAIGYYHAAEKAYSNAAPEQTASIRTVQYKAVAAQFKGATSAFIGYFTQRAQKTNEVKESLLDALIFYSSIADTVQRMYSGTVTPALQQKASQHIASYLATQKSHFATNTVISSTSPGQALTTLMLNDTQLNSLTPEKLRTLVDGGFDSCAAPLSKPDSSTDARDEALACIASWSSSVTGALSARYIREFLPEASPEDQLTDLLTAMKAEAHQIFAPSQQYVGSFGDSSS